DSDGLFPGQLARREPIPAPRIASVRKTGILPRVIQSKTGMAQPRSPAGRAGLFLAPQHGRRPLDMLLPPSAPERPAQPPTQLAPADDNRCPGFFIRARAGRVQIVDPNVNFS